MKYKIIIIMTFTTLLSSCFLIKPTGMYSTNSDYIGSGIVFLNDSICYVFQYGCLSGSNGDSCRYIKNKDTITVSHLYNDFADSLFIKELQFDSDKLEIDFIDFYGYNYTYSIGLVNYVMIKSEDDFYPIHINQNSKSCMKSKFRLPLANLPSKNNLDLIVDLEQIDSTYYSYSSLPSIMKNNPGNFEYTIKDTNTRKIEIYTFRYRPRVFNDEIKYLYRRYKLEVINIDGLDLKSKETEWDIKHEYFPF